MYFSIIQKYINKNTRIYVYITYFEYLLYIMNNNINISLSHLTFVYIVSLRHNMTITMVSSPNHHIINISRSVLKREGNTNHTFEQVLFI